MTAGMLVDVVDLRCRYGKREVLKGVGFSMAAGEVVGLIGPNGSGKSSLLKCLGGLRPLTAGSVSIEGRSIARIPRSELARKVAYVPQQAGPSMSLRVIEMVSLGRLPHRGTARESESRQVVLGTIERLGLEPLALRHFRELSGGERQRVLIGRALAQQAQLLLFDEPTSDLDVRHQLVALETVRAVVDDSGVGSVIALHDLALAARFCDRLLMLSNGAVHDQGSWEDVLTSANVKSLFGVGARIGIDAGLPFVIPYSTSGQEERDGPP